MNASIIFIGNSLRMMLNFRGEVISELIRRGHEVTIIAPRDSAFPENMERRPELIELCNTRRVGLLFDQIRDLSKIRRAIKEKVEFGSRVCIFAFSPRIILLSSLALINVNVGRLRYFPFFSGLGALFLSQKLIGIRFLLIFMINVHSQISKTICLNSADADKLAVLLNTDILIMHGEGLPEDKFKFIPDSQTLPRRLVLVSRPIADKGIFLFIAMIAMLRKSGFNQRVIIYGFSEKECLRSRRLRAFAVRCKDLKVELAGQVDDLGSVMTSADVVVLPSKREGMSRVCMEMHALGVPVVASDVPGINDIIKNGKTGTLVSKLTPDAFVQALSYFLNMSDLDFKKFRMKIKNEPRRFFDTDSVIKFYLDCIEGVQWGA